MKKDKEIILYETNEELNQKSFIFYSVMIRVLSNFFQILILGFTIVIIISNPKTPKISLIWIPDFVFVFIRSVYVIVFYFKYIELFPDNIPNYKKKCLVDFANIVVEVFTLISLYLIFERIINY